MTELRANFGSYVLLDKSEAEYVKIHRCEKEDNFEKILSKFRCNGSERINVTLNIATDNNISILNSLFANLSSIAKKKGVDVYSNNTCGNNGISNDRIFLLFITQIFRLEPVINVTSCYLIDLCHLCGMDPVRGFCIPEYQESKCECIPNKNDLSRPYTGDFCLPSESQPTPASSIPSRWTPIVVGVLGGLTGLILVTALFLWVMGHGLSSPTKT